MSRSFIVLSWKWTKNSIHYTVSWNSKQSDRNFSFLLYIFFHLSQTFEFFCYLPIHSFICEIIYWLIGLFPCLCSQLASSLFVSVYIFSNELLVLFKNEVSEMKELRGKSNWVEFSFLFTYFTFPDYTFFRNQIAENWNFKIFFLCSSLKGVLEWFFVMNFLICSQEFALNSMKY